MSETAHIRCLRAAFFMFVGDLMFVCVGVDIVVISISWFEWKMSSHLDMSSQFGLSGVKLMKDYNDGY